MSIPKLYRIWRKKLKELMVDHRYEEARLRNTTHLVVGMYRKQSVHLNEIDLAPGDLFVLGDVTITASNPTPTHIILYWKANEKEPWRLATNIPCVMTALKAYQKRMWIEEMFGDFKGNGFDLEMSRLRHNDRLSRLTLLVCLL